MHQYGLILVWLKIYFWNTELANAIKSPEQRRKQMGSRLFKSHWLVQIFKINHLDFI